jgi:hypothetical protein
VFFLSLLPERRSIMQTIPLDADDLRPDGMADPGTPASGPSEVAAAPPPVGGELPPDAAEEQPAYHVSFARVRPGRYRSVPHGW